MKTARIVAWIVALSLTPLGWRTPAAQGQATPAASAPAQTPSPGATDAICDAGHYTGQPIDVDYQGADLREVLRSVADFGGINLVIDPQVSTNGKVDLALKQVPWDQVFGIVVKSNQLGCEANGAVVRVLPLDLLQKEAKQRTDELLLAQAEQAKRSTQSREFHLNYAKGDAIKAILTTNGFLGQYANAIFDERTNTLVVVGLPQDLDKAQHYITELDMPEPQVEIEARIVETDRQAAKSLGIQWGMNGQMSQALGNTTTLGFPNSVGVQGVAPSTQGTQQVPGGTTGAVINLPASSTAAPTTSGIGLSLGAINGAFNLDVALTALEHAGKTKILSQPKVTTQNNVPAEITQGTTVPYQAEANNTVTIQFRDAALNLKVTPHITGANTVVMDVALENGAPDFGHTVNGNPSINTQKATTKVMVSDGVTTVIGGIVVNTEFANDDKTPGLGNIPLLGWLFHRYDKNSTGQEILIFITPRIIRGVS